MIGEHAAKRHNDRHDQMGQRSDETGLVLVIYIIS